VNSTPFQKVIEKLLVSAVNGACTASITVVRLLCTYEYLS